MTIKMGAKEARNKFADLLGSVHYRDETVIVERAGKPFAVMISPAEYERHKALVRERDVAKIVEEVRQELYEQ